MEPPDAVADLGVHKPSPNPHWLLAFREAVSGRARRSRARPSVVGQFESSGVKGPPRRAGRGHTERTGPQVAPA